MKMDVRVIQSAETTVKKYVFTKEDAVLEAVLYKYPDYESRTVICCSTMSGCPVGCRFCGAGDYFVGSCTGDEIMEQVERCIHDTGVEVSNIQRLQIMFMSMGEPLLNRSGMLDALPRLYRAYPNARLLISTIGPRIDYGWVNSISAAIPTIGLQFSIHESTDEARSKLIPFQKKLTIQEIAVVGDRWAHVTGRRPFFNYCAADHNSGDIDADRIAAALTPSTWEATISVICERNEGLPARNQHQRDLAEDFAGKLLARGFNTRVFDPAGQDDIGGGCGQLWFVQDWMEKHPGLAHPSIGHGRPEVHVPTMVQHG
jgi:23S rRNA (adenine2503-C2)-methyltransferase